MKFLFLLLISFTAFAQSSFIMGDMNLRSLKLTKMNHQIILGKYHNQIDSQIFRLIEGIEYESKNQIRSVFLKELLANLLIKRIFVGELIKQLSKADLDHRKGNVFNTENIKIDLEHELSVQLNIVFEKDNLPKHVMNDFKTTLLRNIAKGVAFKTFKAMGNGLLGKIMAGSITSGMVKSAVISIGSEAFVSAGTSAFLTLLTLPLHAYRLPPETVWTDILKDHPEMILNPEWMKYAGSQDDPWFSHHWAILRRTKHMDKALNIFLQNEEKSFISTVSSICRPAPEVPKKDDWQVMPKPKVDGTYVHRNVYLRDFVPFWAMLRK